MSQTSSQWDRYKATARQAVIGRQLQRMYAEVVNEPIPGDFLDILRRIDEISGGGNEISKPHPH